MTTASWVPRINVTRVVAVTPTISTSAYTSGDQIGGIMTLADVVRIDSQSGGYANPQGQTELVSVTILDKNSQNAAMDIWLFNTSPTIASSDNAAFDMTDANQFAQCIGTVSVGSSYSASASNSTSTTVNLNLPLQITSGTSIYAVAIVRAGPTYTTTTALQFQFGFFVD